jgi:hypothetical protein
VEGKAYSATSENPKREEHGLTIRHWLAPGQEAVYRVKSAAADIYRDLQQRISGGETPVDAGQHFYQPSKDDLVMEGIGCWHPTFPAAGSHITTLATSAVDLVASHLSASRGGLAAVLRRQSGDPEPPHWPSQLHTDNTG